MPFNIIAYIIVVAISALISYLLAPKAPKDPAPQPADISTCEQGTPYGIIFGRPPRFKSTMVLWYGAYSTHHFSNKKKGSGYQYYMAMHLGLSHSNVDGLKQIWFNDRCFWPVYKDGGEYANDGATTFSILQGDAWGGRYNRGGLGLTGDILYGAPDQEQNLTLKKYQDGDSTPTYRGITSLVFHKGYWGISPIFPTMAVVLKRTNLHHDGTQMWYLAKARVDSYFSLNVVHVIRECLTSETFGRGVSTDRIDSVTFEAAADTLYTEQIGISYKYVPSSNSMADFLKKLEDIMDGVIYFDHSVGKYKIKLIRDDYDSSTLDEYDKDDFAIVTFGRQAYYQVPSETIVKYSDMNSAKSGIAKDDDLSIMRIQGESPVSQTFDWPMITNPDTAAKLASREQDQVSKIPAFLRLSTNRSMYAVQRGDVFKITHPRLVAGGITEMTVRVTSIDRGELEAGEMFIDVVEEIFEEAVATNSTPSGSITSVPVPTISASEAEIIEFSSSTTTIQIINETKV